MSIALLIEDVDVALVLGLVCAKVAFDVVARTRNPAAIRVATTVKNFVVLTFVGVFNSIYVV